MYEVFYKLRADPFRLLPEEGFCFQHRSYAKAKAYLQYALLRGEGIALVTGPPGTGKTTLSRELVSGLGSAQTVVARLAGTQLSATEFLRMVAYAFGVNVGDVDKATLLYRIEEFLLEQAGEKRHGLLLVDEAQELDFSVLNEIRLLDNLQDNGKPLLQILLIGQQALRERLRAPEMQQLQQRIVAGCHLEALNAEETRAYVEYRLRQVGWTDDPHIGDKAFSLIHRFSQGIPRRINLICGRLLLHGSIEQKHRLGIQDAELVVETLRHEDLGPVAGGSAYAEDDRHAPERVPTRPKPVTHSAAGYPDSEATIAIAGPAEHSISSESRGATEQQTVAFSRAPAAEETTLRAVFDPVTEPVLSLDADGGTLPGDVENEDHETLSELVATRSAYSHRKKRRSSRARKKGLRAALLILAAVLVFVVTYAVASKKALFTGLQIPDGIVYEEPNLQQMPRRPPLSLGAHGDQSLDPSRKTDDPAARLLLTSGSDGRLRSAKWLQRKLTKPPSNQLW